ncbi:MAG: DUF1566 domain-containing protein [Geobacteraceae bacterium]|nr:DUF1566 domain-containing protein [Geobacteraceae bacterium]
MSRNIMPFMLLIFCALPLLATAGTIQLPRTGQTTCYNSSGGVIPCVGTGQDGELRGGAAWPSPRFAVNGDCVTDNLTGLVWARNGNLAEPCTWQGALDWVAALNSGAGLCGQHDWRLPNLNELESLVSAEQAHSDTWLNSSGFTNVQASNYWSSSTNAYPTSDAWIVNLWHGYVGNLNKSPGYSGPYVWPVRAGQ